MPETPLVDDPPEMRADVISHRMTFREQVAWSRKWGAAALVTGAVLMIMFGVFAEREHPYPMLFVGIIGTSLIAASALLLLFGGVMRPAQRWLYLSSREGRPYGRMSVRDRFIRYADAGFWGWWLHIDAQGNDLDA
jgi:hypothetical protein